VGVQIEWQRPAFEQARRDVMDTHDALRRTRATLARETAELFVGGWSGPAAGQYERAWSEWEHGVESVLGSLLGLVEAMDDATDRLVGADWSVAGQAGQLSRRLGELP
jgi:uncharacterized protein YukE